MLLPESFALGESSPECIAFDFFVGKGFSDFQAAGIVGNLKQESNVNPTQKQIGGGPGRGIAQWETPGRWDTLVRWAADRDPLDLHTQLDFLWHELTTIPYFGLVDLKATTTLEDATRVFQDKFERCGVCATSSRIAFAKKAMIACARISPPSRTSSSILVPVLAVGTVIGAAAAIAYVSG